MNEYLMALLGGVIIGFSVSLLLLFNGRVAGISGITYAGFIKRVPGDIIWRIYFLSGLFLGGLILHKTLPTAFAGALNTDTWTLVVAGLLVGFGTILGSGCTSGHGVCGVSRLSIRSIVATLTFIFAGILSVIIFRELGIL